MVKDMDICAKNSVKEIFFPQAQRGKKSLLRGIDIVIKKLGNVQCKITYKRYSLCEEKNKTYYSFLN